MKTTYKGYTIQTERGLSGYHALYYINDPDEQYSTGLPRMSKEDAIRDARRQIDKIERCELETVTG